MHQHTAAVIAKAKLTNAGVPMTTRERSDRDHEGTRQSSGRGQTVRTSSLSAGSS